MLPDLRLARGLSQQGGQALLRVSLSCGGPGVLAGPLSGRVFLIVALVLFDCGVSPCNRTPGKRARPAQVFLTAQEFDNSRENVACLCVCVCVLVCLHLARRVV